VLDLVTSGRSLGPLQQLFEHRRRAVDWGFNAWGGLQGGLYFPWDQDELVARKVAAIEGMSRYAAPLVMEGGAIHTDGQGTLLVTEQCLLNPNRNPQLSKQQIETYLRDYTGASTIIWLGQGVVNDETDGHVDNLACFARPGEVCLTYTSNRRDAQWAVSNDALERLQAARDARHIRRGKSTAETGSHYGAGAGAGHGGNGYLLFFQYLKDANMHQAAGEAPA